MSIVIAELTNQRFTYDEAVMYCFFLEQDGKKGWRLPTEKEYKLYDNIWGWHHLDARLSPGGLLSYRITPVRDTDE